MISNKSYLRFFFFVFFVLMAFKLSVVKAVNCSPKYVPSGQLKKIIADDLALNIVVTVEDQRDDKDKYFFLWIWGWKSWDPDATKFNEGQKLFLTRLPKDIVKDALTETFSNAGYKITEQKNVVTVKVEINKFRYTLDTWKYKKPFAQISVTVVVAKGDGCYFTKEFHARSEKPVDVFRQIEDAEPVLSKCLSTIVEDIALDGKLKLAIFKAYGIALVSKEIPKPPIETPRQPNNIEGNKTPRIILKGQGTGFAVSENGFVCTNYHVVDGGNVFTVYFPDNDSTYKAKVIEKDMTNDLVILRLKDFPNKKHKNFKIPYKIRSSNSVELAAKTFTIGYPLGNILGISPKFSEGSISSVKGMRDNINQFQISNPIQPGNSGGPLFDKEGNIIGVIVASAGVDYVYDITEGALPQNVNFAIKSDYLMILLKSLDIDINKKEGQNELPESIEDKVKAIKPYIVVIQTYVAE